MGIDDKVYSEVEIKERLKKNYHCGCLKVIGLKENIKLKVGNLH